MQTKIRTICQSCHCQCGVIATVENGRVTGIDGDPDHPYNRGLICVKGRAAVELLYHPDRVHYPLRKAGGNWQRVSWDEALGAIAEKLTALKESDGIRSIGVLNGTGRAGY